MKPQHPMTPKYPPLMSQLHKPVRSRGLVGTGRQRLLTSAQRKALEQRVRNHAHSLKEKINLSINSEPEPDDVTKARRLIEKHEDGQEKRIEQLESGIRSAAKQVIANLVFDSVESCLIQVQEFEERQAPL